MDGISMLEMNMLYNNAEFLLFPSLDEGFGLPPLEAMACGVPVIASRVSGMEDSIQNGKNGWLLETNTSESLALLISLVLNDDNTLREIGAMARKRAEFFSESKFYNNIVEFYQSLIDKYEKPA